MTHTVCHRHLQISSPQVDGHLLREEKEVVQWGGKQGETRIADTECSGMLLWVFLCREIEFLFSGSAEETMLDAVQLLLLVCWNY